MKNTIIILFFISFSFAQLKGEEKSISFDEFVEKAILNNPNFQEMLISEFYTKYNDKLELPISDMIISLKGQYGLFIDKLDKKRNYYEGGVTLTKLFPSTGTNLSVNYTKFSNVNASVARYDSSLGFEIGQSILKNAFGKGTRLLKNKLHVENDLVHHQIIEAYEDYLATLMIKYIVWSSTYQNLKSIENLKKDDLNLFYIMKNKKALKIAFSEDVDKSELEYLNSEEVFIDLEQDYIKLEKEIKNLCGYNELKTIIPENPNLTLKEIDEIQTQFTGFIENTRSYKMLTLLEKKGVLEKDIAKNNLLPSMDLFVGYKALSQDPKFKVPEHNIYGGLRSDLNIGRQYENASYKIAELTVRRNIYLKKSGLLNIKITLENLLEDLKKEEKLIDIATKKVSTSNKIYEAVKKKYFIGRTSFNDLLLAKKMLISNKQNRIDHESIFQQLIIEWKRLSDSLLKKLPKV